MSTTLNSTAPTGVDAVVEPDGEVRTPTSVIGSSDVVVVGAGPAGLAAAIQLRAAGRSVTLIQKGLGGWQLGQGTVDVLGYAPERVLAPMQAYDSYAQANPRHPYNVIPADAVRRGVQWLADTVGADLLVGDVEHNVLLPTAVGAVRPTSLVQPSMANGACVDGARFVIVGPRQFKDFYPRLVAENLSRAQLSDGGRLQARGVTIDFEGRPGEADSSGLSYARSLDDPARRRELVALLKQVVAEGETVGLPALLGFNDTNAWRDIQDQLGHPVFEIPLPPPGVPGMRLNTRLIDIAKAMGVRVVLGSLVARAETEGDRITALVVHAAGGDRAFRGRHFVFAPGGFESGSLTMDSHGDVHERVFDLPLAGLDEQDLTDGWPVHGNYWGDPQPLFQVGVRVDEQMRVLDAVHRPVHSNLYAAGGILAGATRWRDKTGEGIALGSAQAAVDAILADTATTSAARAASTTTATREGSN